MARKYKIIREGSRRDYALTTLKTWPGAKRRAQREARKFAAGASRVEVDGKTVYHCKARLTGRGGVQTQCSITDRGRRLGLSGGK